MAEFNPNIADRETRDFTGSSRGAEGNKAFEALFSGVGDAVTMGVQTADTYVQNKIEDEVRQEFDTLNTGMGLSVDSVPIELTRSADQLSRLAAAQSQGKISPEYYYANLSATLKGLRAKYPGYDRQVDEIVQRVTGTRPANAFRDALMENLAASERAASSSADKIQTFLRDPKNWAYLNEDEKINPEKYGGPEGQMMIIRERASKDAQVANEVERIKQNKELAEPLINQRFNVMVSDNFGQITGAMGFGDKNFSQILKDATSGGGFTPDQLSNAVAGVDGFIVSTKAQLYAYGNRPEFSHLGPTKIREMVDAAVAPLENVKSMLQAGEYQKATLLASQLELQKNEDKARLFDSDSRIRVADALSGIAPDQADLLVKEAITAVGSGRQFADAMTGVLLGSEAIYDGESSINKTTQKILDNPMSTSKQKSEQILGSLNTMVGQIESGALSEDQISSAIMRNYTPTTEGDNIWGNISDSQKNSLFAKMFSPAVTKQVFEKGSSESQEAYIASAINRFQSVPEFRAAASDLQSAIPLSEFANVSYDEKDNRLRVYVDPNASAGQKFINGTEMARLKVFAGEFNKALGVIAPILEQTGEGEVEAIKALLTGMGVNPDAEKQKSILGWVYDGISTVAEDLAKPVGEEIKVQERGDEELAWSIPEGEELSGEPLAYAAQSAGSSGFNQVVSAGPGWTQVRLANGEVVHRQGARNWRNHNPGNIEAGNFANRWGAVGTDGRFAVFPSYEAGRRAKEALIFETPSYKNLSISDAISRYAPPFENNTTAYAAGVARAAGVPLTTKMSELSKEQRQRVLNAMERIEGFKPGTERKVR